MLAQGADENPMFFRMYIQVLKAVRLLFVATPEQVFAQDGSAFQQLKEQELEPAARVLEPELDDWY